MLSFVVALRPVSPALLAGRRRAVRVLLLACALVGVVLLGVAGPARAATGSPGSGSSGSGSSGSSSGSGSSGSGSASASSAAAAVQVVLTNPNLRSAALSPEPSVSFSTRRLPRGVATLDVDDHRGFQTVLGFGAAVTDTSAWLLHENLSPATRKQALSALFSPTGGLGLSFVRVPVAASDFTAAGAAYTYDDQPAGQSDPSLSGFSIAHDLPYVIPTLQQMLKVNPAIDVISSEWTAPAWMKANDDTGDVNRAGALLPADFPVLAQYLVKFIQAYANAGIPIWAVTPENEPMTNVSYPSMFLTPAQEAQFIASNLAPAFAAAGLSTRIYGGDTGSAQPSFAQAVQSGVAASAVSGEAWHCYGGQQGVSAFHNLFPSVQDLMTECSPGIIPYTGGEAVIDALRNWASSADLWNVALDPNGGPVQAPNQGCIRCTGLLTVDESTHTVAPTLAFYQLGQVSKYVQRGAVRINTQRWVSDYIDGGGHSQVSQGLDNVAFLNPDGSRVLVAYNHSALPITFGVSWNHRQFAYTLGAGAMVTFRWTGAESGTPVNAAVSSGCLNAGVRYTTGSGGQVSAVPDC